MKSGWTKKKIIDVTSYVNRGISPKYTEKDGVVVINQKCIRNNRVLLENSRLTDPNKKKISDEKYVQKYDVLVNSTGVGTLGRIAQVKEVNKKMTVDSHVTIVRADKSLDPIYFGYCMVFNQPKIEKMGMGATGQTELSRDRIKEDIEIEIPESPTEQQKISAILSNYDNLIENNTKRIELLEKIAKLIYEEWFVKFKFPGHEKVKFVDSEFGKIPEGWEIGKVVDLYQVQPGFAFKSKDFCEVGFPIIKIKNIHENRSINLSNLDKIPTEIADKSNKFKLNEKDLLIAMTGATIGKVGIMPRTSINCYLNQRVARFIPNIKEEHIIYLYFFITSPNFRKIIENIALGAAQPNISGGYIENIKMLIPSDEILNQFSEKVDFILTSIINLRAKNQNLSKTRDLLLPRLITGKVDVSELDIQIEVEA